MTIAAQKRGEGNSGRRGRFGIDLTVSHQQSADRRKLEPVEAEQERGRALEAQGKRDQAREKHTEAARMDLSAADRAEVVRRLGAT